MFDVAKKSGDANRIRLNILTVASGLFAKQGIGGTSLFDIAAAAAISKGTLYYHYPTKQLLLEDIVRLRVNDITDTLYAWLETLDREGDPAAALHSLLELLLQEPAALRLNAALQTEAALGNESLVALFDAAYHKWSLMLEVGALKMPPGAALRIEGMPRAMFALLDGFALHELLGMDRACRERLVALLLA